MNFPIFIYNDNEGYEDNLIRFMMMAEDENHIMATYGHKEKFDRLKVADIFKRKYAHKNTEQPNPIHYIT